jgi:hypothetical protein
MTLRWTMALAPNETHKCRGIATHKLFEPALRYEGDAFGVEMTSLTINEVEQLLEGAVAMELFSGAPAGGDVEPIEPGDAIVIALRNHGGATVAFTLEVCGS